MADTVVVESFWLLGGDEVLPVEQVWSLNQFLCWLLQSGLKAELFNIPNWDCPDTVKAPFYEGLERNEHSMSHILWLGVGFLERKPLAMPLECPSPTFQKLVIISWC